MAIARERQEWLDEISMNEKKISTYIYDRDVIPFSDLIHEITTFDPKIISRHNKPIPDTETYISSH